MNPNSPQVPVDYLNSIATPQKQATMKPWLLWVIIGGGLLILIIIVMALLSGGTSQAQKLETIVYRVQALETLTKNSQVSIQSSALRGINSGLELQLANADSGSVQPLASLGVKKLAKKPPKNSPIPGQFTELASTLDDARLNAEYDTVYARELTYQLGILQADIKLLDSHSNKTVKAYLANISPDIQSLTTQFANFNADES